MEQETAKGDVFFRFEDLRVYTKSLEFLDWVHHNTQLIPEHEARLIINRFMGSALSISLNIAEGASRSKMQFVYFLKVSKSAIRECVVYTQTLQKLNLFTDDMAGESLGLLQEMTRMIGALITSIQKANPGKRATFREEYPSRRNDNLD
ncbi:MAG: four helix bundle protein [Bacteroidales bacterium]|nr:four helix bundle protein [Bacteroidales bacterium]